MDNPSLVAELKPIYDAVRPQTFYSAQTYSQVVKFVREHLFAEMPEEEAYFELGRKAFYGYYKGTIVGRVALAALHIISAERLMSMTRHLWEESGLGQCQTEKLAERKYLVSFRNFASRPPIVAGLALEALSATRARNLRYQLRILPAADLNLHDFDVTWEWD